MSWETKDLLTVIGWPVSCAVSIVVGFVLSRITKKRKILAWAVITESELIPKGMPDKVLVPVTIQVGGIPRESLSLVRVCLGNEGNEIIEKIDVAVKANQGATMHYVMPVGDLGEYQKYVHGAVTGHAAVLSFAHINPSSRITFEFLLSEYEQGSLFVDAAGPGITLTRRDPARWERRATVMQEIAFELARAMGPSGKLLSLLRR